MKALGTLIVAAFTSLMLHGQGAVEFHNTSSTPITTNNIFTGTTGLMSGPGNYRFGLYVGPLGSSPGSLTLIGSATNISVPGLFGTSGNIVVPPLPGGSQVSFQVRGWSSFSGNSYEQAFAYAVGGNVPFAYLGQSTMGSFTVPSSGSVIIFGTGPGQVGGFELTPVPEPSAYALSLLGLSLFGAWRLRRSNW